MDGGLFCGRILLMHKILFECEVWDSNEKCVVFLWKICLCPSMFCACLSLYCDIVPCGLRWWRWASMHGGIQDTEGEFFPSDALITWRAFWFVYQHSTFRMSQTSVVISKSRSSDIVCAFRIQIDGLLLQKLVCWIGRHDDNNFSSLFPSLQIRHLHIIQSLPPSSTSFASRLTTTHHIKEYLFNACMPITKHHHDWVLPITTTRHIQAEQFLIHTSFKPQRSLSATV